MCRTLNTSEYSTRYLQNSEYIRQYKQFDITDVSGAITTQLNGEKEKEERTKERKKKKKKEGRKE
jgi:ribosomal protein S8